MSARNRARSKDWHGRSKRHDRPPTPVVVKVPCTREQAVATGIATRSNLEVVTFWRTIRAGEFDPDQLRQLRERRSPVATDAVRARASSAIAEALKLRKAEAIDASYDEAMTELLACALEDAAASLVLSYMLRAAPIDGRRKAGLATSWLVYNLERAARVSGRDPRRGGGRPR